MNFIKRGLNVLAVCFVTLLLSINTVSAQTVCQEEAVFDITILLDSSGSPVTYGLVDEIYEAFDAFIDSVDITKFRVNLMDKRGWGNYQYTGYLEDKNLLKANYKLFGFQGGPPCATGYDGGIPDAECPESAFLTNRLRNFLEANQRTYKGKPVKTAIITLDDGDRAQLPVMNAQTNWDSCDKHDGELTKWQNLDDFGDLYWIRFENETTNSCPDWIQPGVMTRGDGKFIVYDTSDAVTNLLNSLITIFEEQCEVNDTTNPPIINENLPNTALFSDNPIVNLFIGVNFLIVAFLIYKLEKELGIFSGFVMPFFTPYESGVETISEDRRVNTPWKKIKTKLQERFKKSA